MITGSVSPRAQSPAGRQTVLTGHHQIEDQQVRTVAFKVGIELARIGKQQGIEAVTAEVGRQQLPQLGVVVNQENFLHGHALMRHGVILCCDPAADVLLKQFAIISGGDEIVCNRRRPKMAMSPEAFFGNDSPNQTGDAS